MAGSIPASATADGLAAQAPARPRSGWGTETWRRFRRHKLALAGGVILVTIMLAVLAGPWFYKVAINDIDFTARLASPSLAHPLGTDELGRDLLSRLIHGARFSLLGSL